MAQLTVTVLETGTRSVFNDPALANRLRAVLVRTLGAGAVTDFPPVMGAEDFSEFGSAGIPSNLFRVGGAAPAVFAEARSRGTYPPGNHTGTMTPDRRGHAHALGAGAARHPLPRLASGGAAPRPPGPRWSARPASARAPSPRSITGRGPS